MWLTRRPRGPLKDTISLAAFVLAVVAACAFVVSGFAGGAEEGLRDTRDQFRMGSASGEIVIVEIDGRSLEQLDTWPWPRSNYADAIRKLDAMGASQIAFDVDFSAYSNEAEDAALASAFAEIGQPALLPTFRQLNQAGAVQTYTEALPIPEFREHTFVASVNVAPSANGRITYYPYGVITNGVPRPSLANMLANANGAVGADFRVDQAIDINSIPRISFIDLVQGRVASDQVAGKKIVIGATAIELFDRYPTALFGVQPGVAIQVQAAETLLQDRARSDSGQVLPLTLTALVLGLLLIYRGRRGLKWLPASAAALSIGAINLVGALVLDQLSAVHIALASPLLFVGTFVGARRIMAAMATIEAERMTDTATRLPNLAAMQRKLLAHKKPWIAAVRFADFAEIGALLSGEDQVKLERDIARRLQLAAGGEDIYRLEAGAFACFASQRQADSPEAEFAAARAVFNAGFEVAGEKLRLNPHFGLAQGDIKGALDAAETARKQGLGFSADAQSLQSDAQFKQRLLGELDEALENGDISVVFQPKIRLADDAISGAECLVRWESAQLGRVSAADFIPILEEKNRISALTHFVLAQALARREEALQQGHALNIAVNISAQLLTNREFVEEMLAVLSKEQVGTKGGLTLEITESAPLADSSAAKTALVDLAEAGARISIDDYGTGQATLHYLQDFPVQELKLDQSFIRDLENNNKDRIMVQSTIEMAHALGFKVVGEGVETAEILKILRALGCDYVQGWHTGKPAEWSEYFAMVTGAAEAAKSKAA
ncbi:EAL domain-containing protein [uncultured Erythrobacter sp.]|uniref:EAL domain-containing protein n=1 Tax=uncultured Erythrobacter sp. TaxID=263913 RepID=UPI00262FCFEC|nr:EAL domain-containing protein [uncultured Erythrobacter sp.]